jgi:coenzyme F420-reducing hydrogenase delta subunit
MCSARVDKKFIWHAFLKGAPVVLISGRRRRCSICRGNEENGKDQAKGLKPGDSGHNQNSENQKKSSLK